MSNKEILENMQNMDAEIETLSQTILKELTNFISLLRRLLKAMKLRWQEKERVMAAIARLDSSLYRTVLVAVYIEGASVISVSQRIHYSESRTYEILREAERRLKL